MSAGAAEVLGLSAGTAVGTALIDAHAGGLGLLGCKALESYDMTQRLALITGTSSCQVSKENGPKTSHPACRPRGPGGWLSGPLEFVWSLISRVISL